MLNVFIDWARSLATGEIKGVTEARVTEGKTSDNRSARLDVDTPTAVARITCWDSGDYDAEIIDLESEQQTFSRHGTLRAGESLTEQLGFFCEALGIAAPHSTPR